MRKVLLFLSTVVMLLTSLPLFAQQRTITGTVVSGTGEPLEVFKN